MTEFDRVVQFTMLMTESMSPVEVKRLANDLFRMGFFIAPASTKYHGAYPGGLFDHSFAVTKNLLRLTKSMNLKWEREESPYLVGMLHDLCKYDQYSATADGNYEWVKDLPLPGHGEKSIILAHQLGVYLTEEEMLAIRWHMGAFDDKANWNCYGNAIRQYPNVLWAHTADMMASHIQGV